MKIHVFVFTWNDEDIIAYTMRHYNQFAKVTIVDNGSTDRTVEIAESMGAEIRHGDMQDELDDIKLIKIKNDCWEGSQDDWVIVVDADELVYHSNLIGMLEKSQATIIQPVNYEMFSEKFPTTPGQIYEEIKTGVIGGGYKKNLFRPKEITTMNWDVGCHWSHPEGNVIVDTDSGIITLHMKNLSKQRLLDRFAAGKKRLSAFNKQNQLSVHYTWDPQTISEYFDSYMKISIDVLSPTLHVIIAAYQRIIPLRIVIDSFIVQTNPNWRVYVIHDGPMPKELDVIMALYKDDPRISFQFTEERIECSGFPNRDMMIKKIIGADNDFVMSTNDDNYYATTFVENMIALAEQGVGFVYCNMVHSGHWGPGEYQVIDTKIEVCQIDIGAFAVKLPLAKKVGITTKTAVADGIYAEACLAECNATGLATAKTERILYVHN